ncbi:hypothetical protein EC973_006664 [Apophysomyces ossiformis]|uniref:Transcription initiation factor IIF subunit alpha n=1 Tax=Apophysomyces ossiformis TaxID=679940 RepID=A0A8H7EUI9_9FUNG|nr:hypothetical protein EC973_006664 [Apophysomyces ossiformis]
MASIYNTSRSPVRNRGRGTPQRRPMPPGTMGTHLPGSQQQHQAINQQQQSLASIPYSDFQLMSCAKRGKHHLMDFKTSKPVNMKTFARPVKLQRKDANYIPYRQFNAMRSEAGPSSSTPSSANQQQQQTQQQQQQQHGPKTGADTSLIAPMGGATRNKQMLFKKRTKQIFLAKEDTRELKEQEQKPWVLEDYDGQNSFTGTLEGGQRSDYVFFVLSDNGFKVVPVDRWYKFQPKRNYRTLTLEEAEEQRGKAEESEATGSRERKFKIVDDGETIKAGSDDESGRQPRTRHDSDIDDLDFDDVFQDDEEGGGEHELEDEEMKDSKERVKRETKGYVPGGEEQEDYYGEDMNKLTSEGKQMRKLVRDLEKNRAYESDEEGDPYASSAEELGSDLEEDEQKSEVESSQKKVPVPQKKKVSAPPKAPLPKKAHTTKIKKEGLSKPIGRPGSPSMHIKKEEGYGSVGSFKPIASSSNGHPSSPPRETSPNAMVKKRKAEEPAGHIHDAKLKKVHGQSSSSHEVRPSQSTAGVPADEDLITEEEVIETLRGRKMTTKEFLMRFRKRIKKNEQNRDIITALLKKVAKHSGTDDPKTRMLELKPDL